MRKITKGIEPLSLTNWKRQHPRLKRYADLNNESNSEKIKGEGTNVINDIRTQNVNEQFTLCAYCCDRIEDHKSLAMNEHVIARKLDNRIELDFYNIVASCTTRNQCDASHGSQPFQLTPLMDDCETELVFKLSGRVEGTTDRAKETIRVLNLGDKEQNNRSLIEKRKQLVASILLTNGIDPKDGLDDDELIEMVIEDISDSSEGKLEAFAPVVVNVLKSWVA
jgi:uncharacterized protein (TIGR02646 family)